MWFENGTPDPIGHLQRMAPEDPLPRLRQIASRAKWINDQREAYRLEAVKLLGSGNEDHAIELLDGFTTPEELLRRIKERKEKHDAGSHP